MSSYACDVDPCTGFPLFGVVPEGSSAVYTANLVDWDGQPVQSLDVLEVTITDRDTGSVINGRQRQNILNTNGGSFSDGLLTFIMTPDDNVVLMQSKLEEDHFVRFDFSYLSESLGAQMVSSQTVVVRVQNLRDCCGPVQ